MAVSIQGKITDTDLNPLPTVSLVATGTGYSAGQDFLTVTLQSGFYSFFVPDGWSGTVTPSLTDTTFNPTQFAYTALVDARLNQDFIGTRTTNFFRVVRSISQGVPGTTQAYRMVATVTSSNGIDMNLFVYQRLTLEPVTQTTGDVFIKVASPSDIEEYPVGNPDPNASVPYYRLSQVDLLFRNADIMTETWNAIVEDLQGLGRAQTAINSLQQEDVETVYF